MKKINLTNREVTLLEQTLCVPIETFGNEIFKEKMMSDYSKITLLFKEFEKISDESKDFDLDIKDVAVVLKSFIIARDICDPVEFQTLTGFNWNESDNLIIKLINFLEENIERKTREFAKTVF